MSNDRQYVKDSKGNDVRTSEGERIFYSKNDGDSDPKHNQTVYREHNSVWGGSTKVESKFDPSTNQFKK